MWTRFITSIRVERAFIVRTWVHSEACVNLLDDSDSRFGLELDLPSSRVGRELVLFESRVPLP